MNAPHALRYRAIALLALMLVGCTRTPQPAAPGQAAQPSTAEVEQLRARVAELEGQVSDLKGQVAPRSAERPGTAPQQVDRSVLINPTYENAAADAEPMAYRKTASADLDGDGAEETVTVVTTAPFIPDCSCFAWDDGHPWYVYVDEPDGTRTTLFANWVQLGMLRVVVGELPTSVIITAEGGAGTTIYRVVYRGPQETETEGLASFRTGVRTTFPPDTPFVE